jgi:hypothetical protein
MVKYTAGGANAGDGADITQSIRSSVGFSRQAAEVGNTLRWRAMSNLDGHSGSGTASDGCDGPWCEFYTTVDALTGDVALYVVKGADRNTVPPTDGPPMKLPVNRTNTRTRWVTAMSSRWSR